MVYTVRLFPLSSYHTIPRTTYLTVPYPTYLGIVADSTDHHPGTGSPDRQIDNQDISSGLDSLPYLEPETEHPLGRHSNLTYRPVSFWSIR